MRDRLAEYGDWGARSGSGTASSIVASPPDGSSSSPGGGSEGPIGAMCSADEGCGAGPGAGPACAGSFWVLVSVLKASLSGTELSWGASVLLPFTSPCGIAHQHHDNLIREECRRTLASVCDRTSSSSSLLAYATRPAITLPQVTLRVLKNEGAMKNNSIRDEL